jgi:four helix bundle protein
MQKRAAGGWRLAARPESDRVTIRNYRDLIAWQSAMDLTEAVYTASASWPKTETFGLSAQVRAAAVSVSCNIAEGKGRRADGEFRHFLSIAHGSVCEVETCVLLAGRFGYLKPADTERLLEHTAEVGRLVTGLSNSIPAKGKR